jgi:hypothetical protein
VSADGIGYGGIDDDGTTDPEAPELFWILRNER